LKLQCEKPSVVALAAILNSAEGIDEKLFSAKSRFDFLQCIASEAGLHPFSIEVNAARVRLLDLFSKDSGYELPQIANLTPIQNCAYFSSKCGNNVFAFARFLSEMRIIDRTKHRINHHTLWVYLRAAITAISCKFLRNDKYGYFVNNIS